MSGRHHGQGGGHRGGGHHRDQSGHPSAPAAAGTVCPVYCITNMAIMRSCQGYGGTLALLRCVACNADLAAGVEFCGACGVP